MGLFYFRPLICFVVIVEIKPTFRRNVSLQYSNMYMIGSSETSVYFEWTKQHYIPEDSALRNYLCEKFKSYMNYVASNGEMTDA
jgi:NAD+--asparagine ADP-ribosyltransferase